MRSMHILYIFFFEFLCSVTHLVCSLNAHFNNCTELFLFYCTFSASTYLKLTAAAATPEFPHCETLKDISILF